MKNGILKYKLSVVANFLATDPLIATSVCDDMLDVMLLLQTKYSEWLSKGCDVIIHPLFPSDDDYESNPFDLFAY